MGEAQSMQASRHDAETVGPPIFFIFYFALVASSHLAQNPQGCDGTFCFARDLTNRCSFRCIPASLHYTDVKALCTLATRCMVSGKGSAIAASQMGQFRGRCSYKVGPSLPWLICNVFRSDSEGEASERLE